MSSLSRRPDRLRHALLSQIASQLVRLLVALGIGGWLARYLGPSALGQLSYVTALVGVFGPLGSLGIKGSLAALLCEPKPVPGLLSTALCLELAGTALLSLCLLPWMILARQPVIAALIGFGVVANLFNSFEVFEAQLLNQHRGTLVGRANMFKVFSGALLTVAALLAQAPLVVFGSVQAFQNVVGAVCLAWSSRASGIRRMLSDINWTAAKLLLNRGIPLVLASFSTMLYMKSDQVMLQWMRGPGDVGQYAIAIRLAEVFYFLPVILSETYFPRITSANRCEDPSSTLRIFYRWSWLLGIALMLLSMIVLPWLVPVIFGDSYMPARAALICLGPANFAACTGCASAAWLNANAATGLCAQRSAIGAVVNVVFNLVLIPRCGIVGAAIATSMAQVVSVVLFPFLIRSTRSNTRLLLWPWGRMTPLV